MLHWIMLALEHDYNNYMDYDAYFIMYGGGSTLVMLEIWT